MVESNAGSPPALTSTQPRSRLRGYVIGGLLILLVGAGGGGWAMTEYLGWRSAADQPKQLAITRSAANQPAADMVPRAPLAASAPPTSRGDAPELTDRVAALEARLAQLSMASDNLNDNAARAEALLIAFAVRRALDRGLALGTLESQLRLRFGDAQPNAVRSVIEAAQSPVTLDRLQTEFDRLIPELTGQSGAEAGIWAGLRRGVGALFVVRRADAPSTRVDERVARAQRFLDAGLVEMAAREVGALPGAAAAQSWLAEAARYHEARRALDLIETAAILAPQEAVPTATATNAAPRRP